MSSLSLYAEDANWLSVDPDKLSEGISEYIQHDTMNVVYEFVAKYVSKLYSDSYITNRLQRNPGTTFFQLITPSDISYILSLVKNGKDMWDQDDRMAANPHSNPEKKLRPLFTSGRGKKREYGTSLWTDEGMEFYYTGEKNWKHVYNTKALFTKLIHGWEKWIREEGADDMVGEGGNVIKCYYKVLGTWTEKDAETARDGKRRSGDSTLGQELKDSKWWEKDNDGYTSDLGLIASYDSEDVDNDEDDMDEEEKKKEEEEEEEEEEVEEQGESVGEKDTGEKDGDKVENASRKRKASTSILNDDDKSGGRELGLEVAGAATRRGTRNTNK